MSTSAPARGHRPGDSAAFTAIVSGRVQGVGFRYSARREALRLGLTGWVRNLDDGSVELRAEGPRAALADFRAWLQEGPPGAWVEGVDARVSAPTGSFSTFDAIP